MKTLAENRKARFDYEIIEPFEAGIELLGTEVKSIKLGRASLKGSFVTFREGQPFLLNTSVPPYQPANAPADYDPTRSRRLLLTRKQIDYLLGKSKEQGLTVVPLKLYNKRGLVKVEIALVRGKRKYDKRETLKKRAMEREIERAMRTKE